VLAGLRRKKHALSVAPSQLRLKAAFSAACSPLFVPAKKLTSPLH